MQQQQQHPWPHLQLQAHDYVVSPVEASLRVSLGDTTGGHSGAAAHKLVGLQVTCAPVTLQLSQQQLLGMARLADDVTIWVKRNEHGRHRPPGWVTLKQAEVAAAAAAGGAVQVTHPPRDADKAEDPLMVQISVVDVAAESPGDSPPTPQQQQQQAVLCVLPRPRLVPTCRHGLGSTPVTWGAVWRYAIQATLSQLHGRQRQRAGGGGGAAGGGCRWSRKQQQDRR
jgi:hypothetical protein